MQKGIITLIFLISLIGSDSQAKDFGVHGPLFAIQEKNLLEVVYSRLKDLEKEGKIALLQEEMTKKVKKDFQTPYAHPLPKVIKDNRRLFDPSFVASHQIKDHEGNIMIEKGAKINPLDTFRWGDPLLLLDGEDQAQINWAKSQKGKWVLIKGNPFEIEKTYKRQVFFDQLGRIIHHFEITHVPAKISQQGKLLLIEELPVSEH